jgi:hypothetical protein
MRIIKLGIISVIVLFLILTAMSSLLPSQILVSRAVDVRGQVPHIKEQLFRLQNWQQWMSDAKGQKGTHSFRSDTLFIGGSIIKPVSGTDSTFITSWTPGQEILSTFRIINHRSPDSLVTIQWQMEQDVQWYPWQKFASITKDEIWGGAMEKSLDNLKTILESR